MTRIPGKASKTPALESLLEARRGGYFRDTGERGDNPETAWLFDVILELAGRCARLESKATSQAAHITVLERRLQDAECKVREQHRRYAAKRRAKKEAS